MNLQASYFSIGNSVEIIDWWLNPYRYNITSRLHNKDINVFWTKRAQQVLSSQSTSLIIEMQIYFSCVIKKRVLFHERSDSRELDSINVGLEFEHLQPLPINGKISITSRSVQSGSCSPIEFAKNYPIIKELTSASAKSMNPRILKIDYKNNQWQGVFTI